ncbi:hypothetical protein WUBG_08753 [Wuchereria bancrofti]|uniref:Uncharacterized protein n=1 Tax=Wuchereria bancrofti TaxID=6293 RepID=J9EDQ1_WUCBA|nr:hypothetical protein WUBG_08753 [Wuchereria bancrofti]
MTQIIPLVPNNLVKVRYYMNFQKIAKTLTMSSILLYKFFIVLCSLFPYFFVTNVIPRVLTALIGIALSLIGEENDSFPWTSTDSDCSLNCEVDSVVLLSDCERRWKQHMRRKYFLPQIEGYIDFIIM